MNYKIIHKVFLGSILSCLLCGSSTQAFWPFSRAVTEDTVVSPSEAPVSATKIHLGSDIKAFFKGVLPAAAGIWAYFFMPEQIKRRLPKDILALSQDPKIVAPLWFFLGTNVTRQIIKIRDDILQRRGAGESVLNIGGEFVEKGISGAFDDPSTRNNVKVVLKELIYDLIRDPSVTAKLLPHVNLVSFGESGSSDEKINQMVDQIAKSFGPRLDQLIDQIKGIHGKQAKCERLLEVIDRKIDDNKPLRRVVAKQLNNVGQGALTWFNNHCNKIDLEPMSGGDEHIDFWVVNKQPKQKKTKKKE